MRRNLPFSFASRVVSIDQLVEISIKVRVG
jgi:hypothetical protein